MHAYIRRDCVTESVHTIDRQLKLIIGRAEVRNEITKTITAYENYSPSTSAHPFIRNGSNESSNKSVKIETITTITALSSSSV